MYCMEKNSWNLFFFVLWRINVERNSFSGQRHFWAPRLHYQRIMEEQSLILKVSFWKTQAKPGPQLAATPGNRGPASGAGGFGTVFLFVSVVLFQLLDTLAMEHKSTSARCQSSQMTTAFIPSVHEWSACVCLHTCLHEMKVCHMSANTLWLLLLTMG